MTHCEKVLDRLRQGPASHLELYALGTVAHSRISDLRKKGCRIEQWRDGDLYFYRLLSETPATPQAVGGLTGVSLSIQNFQECRARRVGAEGAAEQLTLGTA